MTPVGTTRQRDAIRWVGRTAGPAAMATEEAGRAVLFGGIRKLKPWIESPEMMGVLAETGWCWVVL